LTKEGQLIGTVLKKILIPVPLALHHPLLMTRPPIFSRRIASMNDSSSPLGETPYGDSSGATGRERPSTSKVPPVNKALVLAAVRNEIPEEEAREIFRLVHTHPDWHDAYEAVLLDEVKRGTAADRADEK
jgi:hypothetical protein